MLQRVLSHLSGRKGQRREGTRKEEDGSPSRALTEGSETQWLSIEQLWRSDVMSECSTAHCVCVWAFWTGSSTGMGAGSVSSSDKLLPLPLLQRRCPGRCCCCCYLRWHDPQQIRQGSGARTRRGGGGADHKPPVLCCICSLMKVNMYDCRVISGKLTPSHSLSLSPFPFALIYCTALGGPDFL